MPKEDYSEVRKLEFLEDMDIQLSGFQDCLEHNNLSVLSTRKEYTKITNNLTDILSQNKDTCVFICDERHAHWVGIQVKPKTKEILFIDPLAHNMSYYKDVESQINKSLKDHKKNFKSKYKVKNLLDEPIQYDGVNCGRFVATALLSLDQGVPPENFKLPKVLPHNASPLSARMASKVQEQLFVEPLPRNTIEKDVQIIMRRTGVKAHWEEYKRGVEVIAKAQEREHHVVSTDPKLAKIHEESIKLADDILEVSKEFITEQANEKFKQSIDNFKESATKENAEQLEKQLDKTLKEMDVRFAKKGLIKRFSNKIGQFKNKLVEKMRSLKEKGGRVVDSVKSRF